MVLIQLTAVFVLSAPASWEKDGGDLLVSALFNFNTSTSLLKRNSESACALMHACDKRIHTKYMQAQAVTPSERVEKPSACASSVRVCHMKQKNETRFPDISACGILVLAVASFHGFLHVGVQETERQTVLTPI